MGKLDEFVNYLLTNEMKPEFLAWWALGHVRLNWASIISQPNSLPLEAYAWMKKTIAPKLEAARNVVAPTIEGIQFNVPPSVIHMIDIGMFPNNKHIKMKTIWSLMVQSNIYYILNV